MLPKLTTSSESTAMASAQEEEQDAEVGHGFSRLCDARFTLRKKRGFVTWLESEPRLRLTNAYSINHRPGYTATKFALHQSSNKSSNRWTKRAGDRVVILKTLSFLWGQMTLAVRSTSESKIGK
jgi:hypothetical protein